MSSICIPAQKPSARRPELYATGFDEVPGQQGVDLRLGDDHRLGHASAPPAQLEELLLSPGAVAAVVTIGATAGCPSIREPIPTVAPIIRVSTGEPDHRNQAPGAA